MHIPLKKHQKVPTVVFLRYTVQNKIFVSMYQLLINQT